MYYIQTPHYNSNIRIFIPVAVIFIVMYCTKFLTYVRHSFLSDPTASRDLLDLSIGNYYVFENNYLILSLNSVLKMRYLRG